MSINTFNITSESAGSITLLDSTRSPATVQAIDSSLMLLITGFKNYPAFAEFGAPSIIFHVSPNGFGIRLGASGSYIGKNDSTWEAVRLSPVVYENNIKFRLKSLTFYFPTTNLNNRFIGVFLDKNKRKVELKSGEDSNETTIDFTSYDLVGSDFDVYPVNNTTSFLIKEIVLEAVEVIDIGKLTIADIRALIDEALRPYLGVYQFPKQLEFTATEDEPAYEEPLVTIPAIAVLPDNYYGAKYPPTGTTVSGGLEVVIHKPTVDVNTRLSKDSIKTYKWEIFINQWEGNNLINSVEALIDKFIAAGLKITSPVYPTYQTELGMISYARLAVIERVFKPAA